MKKLLLLIFTITIAQYSIAQSTNTSKLSIGIVSKLDYFKYDSEGHHLFRNDGLTTGWSLKNSRFKLKTNLLYSHRRFKKLNSFGAIPFGSSGNEFFSTSRLDIRENILDIEQYIEHRLLPEKNSPIVGFGWALQLPFKVNGYVKRTSSRYRINDHFLNVPDDIKPAPKIGLHGILGYALNPTENLEIAISLENKFYFNSNSEIYHYGEGRYYKTLRYEIGPRPDIDHSYLLSLSISHKINFNS